MFQILDFTEARLASVTNRIEKHGDEDVPAVSLAIEITTANTILDTIDPGLRHALYKAVEGQEQLPGVDPSTPVLRCNSIDSVALTTAHEGWTLAIDDGIDETEPMVFGDVKVDKFRVDAKQGGSITLRTRLGTSDIDADRLGALGMHNGQSIWIKLTAPEKKAEAPVIDGTTAAFQADHPGASAEDLFAAGASDGDAPMGDPDEFDGDNGDESEGGATDADVGASEQAEIEAGMAATVAAAGLKPKRGRRAAA